MAAITVAKLQMSAFTNKEWSSCKYFRAFNTVGFEPILLQLVLQNKQAPLKDQG